jgi:hypothetical protein
MKQFTHMADPARVASLARRYPDVARQEHHKPAHGLFTLHFNNKKRQLPSYQSFDCEGVCYSDGTVHLNTHDYWQREFASLREMRTALEEYGDCVITWVGGEQ